jgi:hypothetical protein
VPLERDEWLDGREITKHPLVFRGRLEEEDIVNMKNCQIRLVVNNKTRWLVGGLGTFLLGLGILFVTSGFFTERDTRLIALFIPLIGLFLLGYLVFLSPGWQARLARRGYRRLAGQFRESQVTLTAGRVTVESDAMRTESRWEMVSLVADTPAGLLFLGAGGHAWFWLPNRVLEGDETRGQVLALAESNGVRVRRVG